MAATLESELKYRAETDAPFAALSGLRTLGPATLGQAQVAEELDRYLDTEDGRLGAARWACRLRTREGRTLLSLKGPAEHAAGALIHRRPELEGPAGEGLDPASWPPSEARQLLRDLTGGGRLAERLALSQRRTERGVWLDRRRIGLLSLDQVRVVHDGRELGRLRIVELELDPAALAGGLDPAPLERSLAVIDGLAPDPATKLEHALALLARVGR